MYKKKNVRRDANSLSCQELVWVEEDVEFGDHQLEGKLNSGWRKKIVRKRNLQVNEIGYEKRTRSSAPKPLLVPPANRPCSLEV
jgi:hypothetical protein